MRRVCVLGSINLDMVVGAPRLPRAGETLLGGAFATHPGGKGSNQAVAAARAGAATVFVGAVGDDAFGPAMKGVLSANGVGVDAVAVRAGAATGIAVITVAEDGENTIVVAPGANATVSPADAAAAREVIAGCDALLMQLEVPVETVRAAAEVARRAGRAVVLNAAPARELAGELLALVDVLVVNETEAAIVAGIEGGTAAGVGAASGSGSAKVTVEWEGARGVGAAERALVERCAAVRSRLAAGGVVVLTLGAAGCVAVSEESGRARARHVPAFAVKPVDTVAAGDAFVGTLTAEMSGNDGRGVDERALRWASAAGALATQKAGAIPSLPTRREIEAFMAGR